MSLRPYTLGFLSARSLRIHSAFGAGLLSVEGM